MKNILSYILPILLFFLGCKKDSEIHSKEHPFLLTHEANNINKEGVTFRAEFLNANDFESVKEAGFVFSKDMNPTLNSFRIIILDNEIEKSFSYTLRSNLIKGQKYFVRAYAKHKGTLIYGNKIHFTSNGCIPLKPEIVDFSPKEGTDGNSIKIYGENFNLNKNLNDLKIGKSGIVIDSITQNLIYGRIPNNVQTGTYPIELTSQNQIISSEAHFTVKSPVLNSYSPLQGFDNTLLVLNGNFLGESNSTSVRIGDKFGIIQNHSDSLITLLTPTTDFYGETSIIIDVGGKMNSGNNTFNVLRQSITSISPLKGSIGNRINIEGNLLNPNGFIPEIYFNDESAISYDNTNSSVKAIVPYSNDSSSSRFISIKLGNKTVNYEMPFQIIKSWSRFAKIEEKSRSLSLSVHLKNVVYYGLGYSNTLKKHFNDFWKYDINSEQWTELAPLHEAEGKQINHAFSYMFLIENSIYAILDFIDNPRQCMYKYNISNNSWIRMNDLIDGKHFFWVGIVNDDVYAMSNYNSYENAKVFRYNLENDAWDYLHDFNKYPPLFHFVLDNKLYIYPQQYYSSSGQFYEYNIELNQLVEKKRFRGRFWPYKTTDVFTFEINNKGFLLYDDFWEYDPVLNNWIQRESTEFKTSEGSFGYTKDNKIYYGDISKENKDGNYIYEFDPLKN